MKKIFILGLLIFCSLIDVNAQYTKTATEGYVDRSISNLNSNISSNYITKLDGISKGILSFESLLSTNGTLNIYSEGTEEDIYNAVLYSRSEYSIGIYSESSYNNAIFGSSSYGIGVYGYSLLNSGVIGYANNTKGVAGYAKYIGGYFESLNTGLVGMATESGPGVYGYGLFDGGIVGQGAFTYGVKGYAPRVAGYFEANSTGLIAKSNISGPGIYTPNSIITDDSYYGDGSKLTGITFNQISDMPDIIDTNTVTTLITNAINNIPAESFIAKNSTIIDAERYVYNISSIWTLYNDFDSTRSQLISFEYPIVGSFSLTNIIAPNSLFKRQLIAGKYYYIIYYNITTNEFGQEYIPDTFISSGYNYAEGETSVIIPAQPENITTGNWYFEYLTTTNVFSRLVMETDLQVVQNNISNLNIEVDNNTSNLLTKPSYMDLSNTVNNAIDNIPEVKPEAFFDNDDDMSIQVFNRQLGDEDSITVLDWNASQRKLIGSWKIDNPTLGDTNSTIASRDFVSNTVKQAIDNIPEVVIPPYDNTQIISINSNHFVKINNETNLVMYEIEITELTPVWHFIVSALGIDSTVTEISYPLTSQFFEFTYEGNTYNYGCEELGGGLFSPSIYSSTHGLNWGAYGVSGTSTNIEFISIEPNGLMVYIQGQFSTSTNLFKTFASMADLQVFLSHIDNTNIHVTLNEKQIWNNKITNNQNNVILGLASGTTVAEASSGNEPISLDQALSLLSASSDIYLNPMECVGCGVGTTNRSLSSTYSPTAWTVVWSGSVTAGQYLFSYTAPSNLVTSVLAGNQTANIYITYTGGGASTLSCKLEGYIFDPSTTTSVEYAETSATFDVVKTAIIPAAPTHVIAIIPYPTNLTGNLRYQIRVKAITAANITSVTMWGGSNTISHITLPVADSVVLGNRGATSIQSSDGVMGTYDNINRKLIMPELSNKANVVNANISNLTVNGTTTLNGNMTATGKSISADLFRATGGFVFSDWSLKIFPTLINGAIGYGFGNINENVFYGIKVNSINLGPTINSKQSTQYTDGTNLFFVDVNSKTNILNETPSIYTPIYPASQTISVSQTQSIYVVTVDAPNSISNDLSALSFTGQNASWEVWVDYTTTNSLSTVWAADIEWLCTPYLSVTGLYKFAFSSMGNKITAYQNYPTVFCDSGYLIGQRNNSLASSPGIYQSWSTTSSTNDYVVIAAPLQPTRHIFGRIFYDFVGDLAPTNYATFYGGWGSVQALPANATLVLLAENKNIYAASGPDPRKYFDFIMTPKTSVEVSSSFLYLYARKPYIQGSFSISGIRLRPANELEINAYNAGWRP